ncbi:hydantoinase/oxoprolinase family protein [Aromatoleum toluclasticum]|uniref:hydantoinase/oxoprolinase family protein n=1 Tax=Aromatoleum toluclasticum TaxID=92003 RepID=UPI00035DFCF8|nr:hydantoinase/oxoprolinase family protein [Aromatoleum toluclasticum]
MTYRIGVDVGGTFTDFLLIDADGNSSVFKTSSTPKDPSIGVLNGLREMAEKVGTSLAEFVAQVDLIVHGTTVTTNAVLTGRGVKTGLLTTAGFRDILEMRRGYREELYNNKLAPPPPLVPRDRRLPVVERIDAAGEVVTPLDEASLRAAVAELARQEVEAVAVCFMHSYANPAHEQAAKAMVAEMLPGAYLTVSSEVLPQARMYERVSTAALNSYIGPILRRYLDALLANLKDIGFGGVLLIMQSNGGVATPASTDERAAMTLLSGPASGPTAGITFAAVQGYDGCMTVDMGGTSFDASVVQNGVPLLRSEGWINRQRLALPMLDIHTIGSGGGSIGWIDDGGLLRMGPQSAGADPGPACYGRGGTLPTCTDANLVLGYLDPQYFLGGRMKLDVEAARTAIDTHVAKPLGLSIEEAAAGMYHLMNVNMAAGLREITVSRGIDPREFPLVVAGGAGPIHGAMIALELELPVILVPKESSIFCASGMLRSDFKHSYVRTYHALASKADARAMIQVLGELEREGRAVLHGEKVEDRDRVRVDYAADMRYLGQHNEITCGFDVVRFEAEGLDYLREVFHREHDNLYGYSLAGSPTEIEVVNLRVTVVGITAKPAMRFMARGEDSAEGCRKGTRRVYLAGERAFRDVPVYDGEAMVFGNLGSGPALIEQITTTTLVSPEYDFVVDRAGTFCLFRKEIAHTYLRRVLK